jgi:hypothetical protein
MQPRDPDTEVDPRNRCWLHERVTVVGIALLVALVVVANSLWLLSIRYAADIERVEAPNGRSYDVLVHRDGVLLYGRNAAFFNVYSVWLTLLAVLRRWVGRRRWRWAIIVRPSPFPGYRDLLRDVYDDEAAARARSREVIGLIRDGRTLWPADAEWFR